MSNDPRPSQTAAEFLSGMPQLPPAGEVAVPTEHGAHSREPYKEHIQAHVGGTATDPTVYEAEIMGGGRFPDTEVTRFLLTEGPSVFGVSPARTGGKRPTRK